MAPHRVCSICMASRRGIPPIAVALFGAFIVAGCSDSTPGDQENGGTQGEEDGNPAELTPARGISIAEVEINQGTRVPIGIEDGQWVGGADRLGFLIASRDSLMRIHYTVDEDWVPREIDARLTLRFPDGSEVTLTDRRMVEHDSIAKNFNGPFWFGLAASDGYTVAGTEYQIELWEVTPGAGDAYEEGANVNPAEGSRLIGFELVPMEIKSLLVPITYNGTTANLDEATTETVLDNLYEQNPATAILYDVHEPYVYSQQLTDLGQLLPVMASLRAMENAEPNLYYHALVNVGSQSLAQTLGISYLANDQKTDANRRVSATVLWEPNPSIAADTYTHETGHAQGRNHTECPNRNAAGPDPMYPHDNGRIGNWGFGIRRFLMYDPDDAFDYMSYCSPSWVSDWTWNKTYARIKTLTSWDYEGPSPDAQPMEDMLFGAIYPDGRTEWWTMPSAVDPDRLSSSDLVEFELEGGEIIEAYAEVSRLSHGEVYWVSAPLPEQRESISDIRLVRNGEAQPVPTTALDIGTALDTTQLDPQWRPHWKAYTGRGIDLRGL